MARSTKHALETESREISNEATCSWAKGERVAPEVPLECDDGTGEHASPDEGEGGLSAGEARVEERETGNHGQDHGRSHENEGLVTRLVPLVQIFGDCSYKSVFLLLDDAAQCLGREVAPGRGCNARHVRSSTWEKALTRVTTSGGIGAIELGRRASP